MKQIVAICLAGIVLICLALWLGTGSPDLGSVDDSKRSDRGPRKPVPAVATSDARNDAIGYRQTIDSPSDPGAASRFFDVRFTVGYSFEVVADLEGDASFTFHGAKETLDLPAEKVAGGWRCATPPARGTVHVIVGEWEGSSMWAGEVELTVEMSRRGLGHDGLGVLPWSPVGYGEPVHGTVSVWVEAAGRREVEPRRSRCTAGELVMIEAFGVENSCVLVEMEDGTWGAKRTLGHHSFTMDAVPLRLGSGGKVVATVPETDSGASPEVIVTLSEDPGWGPRWSGRRRADGKFEVEVPAGRLFVHWIDGARLQRQEVLVSDAGVIPVQFTGAADPRCFEVSVARADGRPAAGANLWICPVEVEDGLAVERVGVHGATRRGSARATTGSDGRARILAPKWKWPHFVVEAELDDEYGRVATTASRVEVALRPRGGGIHGSVESHRSDRFVLRHEDGEVRKFRLYVSPKAVFRDLKPGRWQVTQQTADPVAARSTEVVVEPGRWSRIEFVEGRPSRQIRMRFRCGDEPARDWEVSASTSWLHSVPLDAFGEVALDDVVPETYRKLKLTRGALTWELSLDPATREVPLPDGTIQVQVPDPDAEVRVSSDMPSYRGKVALFTSGYYRARDRTRHTVRGLYPGHYSIHVIWGDLCSSFAEVKLAAGETADVTLEKPIRVRVDVRIVDERGNPVCGLGVAVKEDGDSWAETDLNGVVRLRLEPGRRLTLEVSESWQDFVDVQLEEGQTPWVEATPGVVQTFEKRVRLRFH